MKKRYLIGGTMGVGKTTVCQILKKKMVTVKVISLLCGEKQLINRLERDVQLGLRSSEGIKRSVERIPLYKKLKTEKIDTSEITAEQAADMIVEL